MYSGDFAVVSHYDKDITIHAWERFDSWCPAEGSIIPEAEALTSFPLVKDFPESTVVVWTENGSAEQHKQVVNLKGVVPKGVKGVTRFELEKDGVWKVRFSPAAVP